MLGGIFAAQLIFAFKFGLKLVSGGKNIVIPKPINCDIHLVGDHIGLRYVYCDLRTSGRK